MEDSIIKFTRFYNRFFNTRTKMVDFLVKINSAQYFPEIKETFFRTISKKFPNENITFPEFCKALSLTTNCDLNLEYFLRMLLNAYSDDALVSVDDFKRALEDLNFEYNDDKLKLFFKMMYEVPYIRDSQTYFKRIENTVEDVIMNGFDD